MINKSIFKAYDIRGVYPSEINGETAYRIGQIFSRYTGAKNIAVCFDGRLASLELARSIIDGIASCGSNVTDIGLGPTEWAYFSVSNYSDIDAAVMVTASHNPKEYDGFKMVIKKGGEINLVRGIDLLAIVDEEIKETVQKGEITQRDISADYLKYIFNFFNTNAIKPLKVVIDASNGMAAKAIPMIADRLPINLIKINFDIDGNFPGHSPNPLTPGATESIKNLVVKEGADIGVIFDGDADRIYLINEKGEFVSADITLLLIAKYLLEKNPNSAISYNSVCSKAVPEFILKWGGKPIRTKVGFVNVREGMILNNGIMGGELSGHYCFKDYFYFDSGFLAFLFLLDLLSKNKNKLSEIAAEFNVYFKDAEMNFSIQDKQGAIQKLKEKYSQGEQDELDGITINFGDWWFNARPSNTEPILRLTIEADTKELLEEKKKELSALLNSFN
jgi:phosphomannomutase